MLDVHWWATNEDPAEVFRVSAVNFPFFHPKDSTAIVSFVSDDAKINNFSYWDGGRWLRTDVPVPVKPNTALYLRASNVTVCVDGPTLKRKISLPILDDSPSPQRTRIERPPDIDPIFYAEATPKNPNVMSVFIPIITLFIFSFLHSVTLRVTTKQTHRHQRSISRPRTTSLQCRRRLQRLRQHHLKKTQKLNGPCNIFVTCIQGFLRYLKVKHLPRRSNLKTVSVKLLLSTQRIIKIWPNGTRSVQMSERRLLQRVGQQMGSGDMLLKTKGRVRRV
ncbi:hypothetical protein B0H16DRAFT_147577 [Mycena metata]|uniref:Uncharacterized protein n=1 Tax=Mycena metata TaxID=1033252 RepID=A0AAD7NSI0_9AGAR|nr:hypothetical protein B0H16DRAFT_147577 [Mycena metata]